MRFSFFLFLIFLSKSIFPQGIADTSINVPMVSVHFSGQLPFADMQTRFGPNLAVGGSVVFKSRNTFLIGLNGNYFFGSNVKEDVTKNMKNSDGFVVDNEGFPADLRVTERGFTAYIIGGKVFPKLGHNPNSGLTINLGFGYMQHKIKLYDANQKIAAINGSMAKGYDRLSGGFSMHQYLGYTYLSDNRLVNFTAGLEFYEGFTKSYREFNYDTGMPDTENRLDVLVGLRIGWILPLYRRLQDFYYD